MNGGASFYKFFNNDFRYQLLLSRRVYSFVCRYATLNKSMVTSILKSFLEQLKFTGRILLGIFGPSNEMLLTLDFLYSKRYLRVVMLSFVLISLIFSFLLFFTYFFWIRNQSLTHQLGVVSAFTLPVPRSSESYCILQRLLKLPITFKIVSLVPGRIRIISIIQRDHVQSIKLVLLDLEKENRTTCESRLSFLGKDDLLWDFVVKYDD